MAGLLFNGSPHFFAAVGDKCDLNKGSQPLFGFPHWWQYLGSGKEDILGNCTPTVKMPDGLWAIGFAVVDMLLYAAGFLAVFSLIIAGYQFVAAAGSPDQVAAARKRIQNSLIGIVIVIIAAPLVSFIGYKVG